jgi:hypothetical protein
MILEHLVGFSAAVTNQGVLVAWPFVKACAAEYQHGVLAYNSSIFKLLFSLTFKLYLTTCLI